MGTMPGDLAALRSNTSFDSAAPVPVVQWRSIKSFGFLGKAAYIVAAVLCVCCCCSPVLVLSPVFGPRSAPQVASIGVSVKLYPSTP